MMEADVDAEVEIIDVDADPIFTPRRASRRRPPPPLSEEASEAKDFWNKYFSFVYDNDLGLASQDIRFDIHPAFFREPKIYGDDTYQSFIERWMEKVEYSFPDVAVATGIRINFERSKKSPEIEKSIIVDKSFLFYHCPSFVTAFEVGTESNTSVVSLRCSRRIFKVFLNLLYQPWNDKNALLLMRNDTLAQVIALANILQTRSIFLIIDGLVPKILENYEFLTETVRELYDRYDFYDADDFSGANEEQRKVFEANVKDEIRKVFEDPERENKFRLRSVAYLLETLSVPETAKSMKKVISMTRTMAIKDDVIQLFRFDSQKENSNPFEAPVKWSPIVLITVIEELLGELHHEECHQKHRSPSRR